MSAGKILAQARIDAAKFTNSGGFQVDVNLTTKNGSVSVDVTGTGSGRWVNYDNEGNSVNAGKNSIRFAESTLNDAGYPVRSVNSGKVALIDHMVKYSDANGNLKTYVIVECYPNPTTGLIICMLGDAK